MSLLAEQCWDCFVKDCEKYGEKAHKYNYIISKDLDFCEWCEEWKPVVVVNRWALCYRRLRFIIFPFEILFKILRIPYILWKLKKQSVKTISSEDKNK